MLIGRAYKLLSFFLISHRQYPVPRFVRYYSLIILLTDASSAVNLFYKWSANAPLFRAVGCSVRNVPVFRCFRKILCLNALPPFLFSQSGNLSAFFARMWQLCALFRLSVSSLSSLCLPFRMDRRSVLRTNAFYSSHSRIPFFAQSLCILRTLAGRCRLSGLPSVYFFLIFFCFIAPRLCDI